jgi:hypothetical protein
MTTAAIPWFRELYDEILAYRRHTLFYDVLTPWIEKAKRAVTNFGRFRTGSLHDPTDEDAQFAMGNLYALSRVNNLLLLPLQNKPAESKRAPVSLDEYETP